ncbi:MAG: tryptophan synthase subunit alpha [Chitinispirillia bacterium]|nr:tryptophan synthase subunit alpha [Chitinispirillia bacterium]MCL2240911.1 tryptophan synthase subunit alpha [Chitinispirillia bacterium]
MTNRYDEAFAKVKKRKEAAFIPFAVAGDPGPDVFIDIVRAYVKGGADILEIGYPFSDPVADGPVNQRAAMRAIKAGLNHRLFFELIGEIRTFTDIPIGLLTYANSVGHLGCDTFCKKAAKAGIDSILVADMPPEEAQELGAAMRKYGIGRVFIASEFTPEERMREICRCVDSFVYVVSRPGITGADTTLSASVKTTLSRLKKVTDKPLAVGFGISTPEHVSDVRKAGAQGVIVGSALVREIEKSVLKGANPSSILRKKVNSLKAATAVSWKS